MKVIDFHTHIFEEQIAKRAITKLRESANIMNYTDGTEEALGLKNKTEQISLSVVLPVATKIMQADSINARNYKKNALVEETGILYFAAIHPEDLNIRARLSGIKGAGFKGIKLHPVFQNAYIDEKCYLDLIDTASDLGLITVIHAGYDISFPGNEWAGVPSILRMLDTVHPRNVVLAHMGGWDQWDLVESDLAGAEVYFDTSLCLNKLVHPDAMGRKYDAGLSEEQFLRIVDKHGPDRILFGTDSPWSDRRESMEYIRQTGLQEDILEKIFYGNAKKLLNLDSYVDRV